MRYWEVGDQSPVESGTERISGRSWKIVVNSTKDNVYRTMDVERIPETTLRNPYITVVSPSDGPFNQLQPKPTEQSST